MHPAESVCLQGWRAELALRYERRGGRSVLAQRHHDGPLVVQKSLYPEGDAVCHNIVVHPPAGIVGGDELRVQAALDPASHALLTTPGAGKWYRSAGAWAHQRLQFEADTGACLEWLPQETIVFDGALASMQTSVKLAADASYLGWEMLCLGRSGSGERFEHGACRFLTELWCGDRLLWHERGALEGGSRRLQSPAALGGRPVWGTLLASAAAVEAARDTRLLDACRSVQAAHGEGAVTLLPRLMVARYLGTSSEAGRAYFSALWRVLRPAIAGRDAIEPRIWKT